jgi:hypothetical protein
MNPALIILGVVIVLIIYLYFFYSTNETILSDKLDLSSKQPDILVANISKPESTIYSYEFWVYVGKYVGGTPQTLFSRASDKQTSDNKVINNIGVYIDGTSPTLKIDYVKNNSFFTKGTIAVTDNFPVQSWVHVIVSVSDKYIDTYVNGKLTKSIKETDGIYPQSKDSNPIVFGQHDGTILAKLTRTTKATDPQTAWDKYSAGNGENQFSKYLGTLGMDVSLKKDNIEYSKFNLF